MSTPTNTEVDLTDALNDFIDVCFDTAIEPAPEEEDNVVPDTGLEQLLDDLDIDTGVFNGTGESQVLIVIDFAAKFQALSREDPSVLLHFAAVTEDRGFQIALSLLRPCVPPVEVSVDSDRPVYTQQMLEEAAYMCYTHEFGNEE